MTNIVKLRKDSKGLKGTIDNAKHHAELILPFIRVMRGSMTSLGFDKWYQGQNVHVFETTDGRKFTLRAFQRVGVYVGIRLSLRLSRSQEVHLMDIDDICDIPILLNIMRGLATGMKGQVGRSLFEEA